MKRLVFLLLATIAFFGCNNQKNKMQENQTALSSNDSSSVHSDSHDSASVNFSSNNTTNPKVDIRVNKKYDKNGNLVQYDSTYAYFYSTPKGRMERLRSDSLYARFQAQFRSRYNNLIEHDLNTVFFNDSLFKYDFLNNDYFHKRFELNTPSFSRLFNEMDSLKTDMLKQYYPKGEMKRKD
jgi:hypothetical protein